MPRRPATKNAPASLRDNSSSSPKRIRRDPSLSTNVPTTSKELNRHSLSRIIGVEANEGPPGETPRKKWYENVYDKKKKTYCGRSCNNWITIISYGIMYLIFLSTYTMIILYGSLTIIKFKEEYLQRQKGELITYFDEGIGLSVAPMSEYNQPVIWYESGEVNGYEKYIKTLDKLFVNNRKKRDVNGPNTLGPCGITPYGYGDEPCVIIRINKQIKWSGRPLLPDSPKALNAPEEVRKWMMNDEKLWLHCDGYYSYDKEHIGNITYYPYPPGFDPNVFPLSMESSSPLVAIQVSNFTKGLSLAIQCKLWYEQGPSSTEFVLYVSPRDKRKSELSHK